METLKVETPFKGLYTNAVDRNISYSYFADMDKVKVTKQYIQSEEYEFLDLNSKVEIRNIIDSKIVFLDDDKFWYEGKVNKYSPDIQKHFLVVTIDTIYVYLVKDNEDEDTKELIELLKWKYTSRGFLKYVKSIEYQGYLKVVFEDGIVFIGYKRIDGKKTLTYDITFGMSFSKSISIESKTSLQTSNMKISIITSVPIPLIWRMTEPMPLYESNRVPGTRNYDYYGTAYVVSYYAPAYAFSNLGQYDYDGTQTFLFVPIAYVNNRLKYGIVKFSWDTSRITYATTINAIKINREGYVYKGFEMDSNRPHVFSNNDFRNTTFFSNILEVPSNVKYTGSVSGVEEGVDYGYFFQWIKDPFATITYTGAAVTSDPNSFGFDLVANPEQKFVTILETAVYNGNEEIIIAYGEHSDTIGSTKVIYTVNPLTRLSNFITAYKLYIGFGIKPSVFELVQVWSLGKDETPEETHLGYPSLTGILLSNILAIYGNIDEFEYIKGGQDYCMVNNIGFLIKGGTVYYSPNDMTNSVFYKNRYIPNIYGDALISIGGMLGVIRYNKDVTLISIQVIENEIYFKVYDTVSFVIKDRYSYLEIPDGVLMSLREGLYLSTPQSRELLSEPINDIFESGNVSKLLYDDYNRRIMVQSGDDTYVFDLINKVWIKHKGLKLKNIAFDGTDVITIDGSSFSKVVLSEDTEGEITFHKVNLGSNKITKRLVGLRIDLKGTLTTFKNSFGHHGAVNALNEQLGRRIEEFYLPINKQLPEIGLDFKIKFKGKIYGIEVLYDMVGEFVNTKLLEN